MPESNFPNRLARVSCFEFSSFVIWICFEFRASDFGFLVIQASRRLATRARAQGHERIMFRTGSRNVLD